MASYSDLSKSQKYVIGRSTCSCFLVVVLVGAGREITGQKVRRVSSTPGAATEEPEAGGSLLFLLGFSFTTRKVRELVDSGSKGIRFHR